MGLCLTYRVNLKLSLRQTVQALKEILHFPDSDNVPYLFILLPIPCCYTDAVYASPYWLNISSIFSESSAAFTLSFAMMMIPFSSIR